MQLVDRRVVEFNIQDSSSVVFHGILGSGEDNDYNKRYSVQPGIDTTKNWKDLSDIR